MTKKIDVFKERTDKLEQALAHEGPIVRKARGKHFRDVGRAGDGGAPRGTGDELEGLEIPHESWPLAAYREMLFIK